MYEITLSFFKGRRGKTISKLPNGKIALVNKNSRVMVKPREKWICRIDKEFEKFVVVTPIAKIVKKLVFERIRYKCGHEELKPLWEEEVPENMPEPIIKFDSTRKILCPKCRELCKHENTEYKIDIWTFGLIVKKICKDCERTIEEINFSDLIDRNQGFFETDFKRLREAVKQRIKDPELQRKVLAEIDKKEQYVKKYNEIREREIELQEKIATLIGKLRELIKQNFSDFRECSDAVRVHRDYIEYCKGFVDAVTGAIGIGIGGKKLYDTSPEPIYRKISIQELPKDIREVVEEINELREQLDKVQRWLIDNRYVE